MTEAELIEQTKTYMMLSSDDEVRPFAFADSLDEHNANVARYQEAQEAAGGSPTECP